MSTDTHKGNIFNSNLGQHKDFFNENENIKISNINKTFKQVVDKCEKNWFQILENIHPIVVTINSLYKQVFFYIFSFNFFCNRNMIDYLMMNLLKC